MKENVEEATVTCEEVEELLPAYALGALGAGEAATVARHLARCFGHAGSLDAYEAIGDGLAANVPMVSPSPQLRTRLLRSVAAPPSTPLQGRRRSYVGWAVAAALAALVIAFGAWGLSLQRQIDNQAASRARFLELARRPDAHMVPLEAAEGSVAKGMLIYTDSEAAVWAVALPPLEGAEVFQCWWIDKDGERVSGGSFVAGEGPGIWFIPMPSNAEDFDGIGITLEPDGNSADPRGPRILSGDL